ncbi:hypothetical protein [Parasedimentitalea maritima]|uniref:Uncharacterized protein n=1 Tax=Parasedimentitalea maritima TaxID=2578117 RepID=A0A6A4RP10_9RHOB|nr:hypothetical protein [Zongyanglinia marina]KAE9631761.1 hypothetical protein GP644_05505 [Zongyanglinia marina]
MSEFKIEGPELKKMIKLARKGPLPFAFNPGKNESEHYLAMHRKRSAEILGKAAKKEGMGAKVAFGMCVVEEKLMSLTCERAVPALARLLKKFLKANKVSLNVRVLDADGNVLDEDIEDLPTDPSQQDEGTQVVIKGGDAAGLVTRIKAAQPRVAAAPAPFSKKLKSALEGVVAQVKAQDFAAADQGMARIEAALDKLPAEQGTATEAAGAGDSSDLVARIKVAQPLLKQAPDQVGDKLKQALADVVQKIKRGELEPARAVMGQIEAALAKISGTSVTEEAADTSAQQPANADLPALIARLKALQLRIAEMPEVTADKLQKALQGVAANIKKRDAAAAETGLSRIEATLDKLAGADTAQAAAKPEQDPRVAKILTDVDAVRKNVNALPPGDVQSSLITQLDLIQNNLSGGEIKAAVSGLDQVRDSLKLQAAIDRVMPDFVAAMSAGKVADPNKLSILFNTAVELVPGPDHAKAWNQLKLAEEMIAAGTTLEETAQQSEIPSDVQPFAISRLNWNKTRGVLKLEIEKLQSAILKFCSENNDLKEVGDSVGNLTGYIEKLDSRLEDKLDEIVNSKEGEQREAAKKQARSLVNEYQNELNAPFFKDVDQGNGFANVAVASTSRAALGEIDKVLAA